MSDRCFARPVVPEDLQLLLSWRNTPDVRAGMVNQGEISWEEHKAWFVAQSRDQGRSLLVIEREGNPIGFVGFTIKNSSQVAEWSFYVAPGSQPGTGYDVCSAAVGYAFFELGIRKICGQVLVENKASVALHQKLGFKQEGLLRDEVVIDSKPKTMVLFGLLLEEWDSGARVDDEAKGCGDAQVIYVLASCKPWHRRFVEQLASDESVCWKFVSSPSELDALLNSAQPKKIFFLHWNWKVATQVLDAFECICFHMTDVPYGRGGSPLQNLIVKGHADTKLTALRMTDEMDAGPVYAKRELVLRGSAREIYNDAYSICLKLISWMIHEDPHPTPQPEEGVVQFERRKPSQSVLPTNCSELAEVYDFIRMLDAPNYPVAFLETGQVRLEFRDAVEFRDHISATVKLCLKGEA